VAHRIKGEAAALAIEGVREAALRIEEDARGGRLDEARRDLEGLRARVTAFREEVEGAAG
jgi:hypothetical protein